MLPALEALGSDCRTLWLKRAGGFYPDIANASEKAQDTDKLLFLMVPGAGLEPALLFRKRILSPQRLPIPPPGRDAGKNGG